MQLFLKSILQRSFFHLFSELLLFLNIFELARTVQILSRCRCRNFELKHRFTSVYAILRNG